MVFWNVMPCNWIEALKKSTFKVKDGDGKIKRKPMYYMTN
jgi:hypothetical protein